MTIAGNWTPARIACKHFHRHQQMFSYYITKAPDIFRCGECWTWNGWSQHERLINIDKWKEAMEQYEKLRPYHDRRCKASKTKPPKKCRGQRK